MSEQTCAETVVVQKLGETHVCTKHYWHVFSPADDAHGCSCVAPCWWYDDRQVAEVSR